GKALGAKRQVDVGGADNGDHVIHLPRSGWFRLLLGAEFAEDARMRSTLALLAGLCAVPIAAESPSAVRLDAESYAELARGLKGLKGQVVLVDVWGTFCAPCKEKFPKVVGLHEKYGRHGLAVVSVSVDSPDDADAREAARSFLTARRAAFHNVILTDK